MRLTRKKAIELCIELWTWLAKTGKRKGNWPKWDKYGDDIASNCWFCEYNDYRRKQNKTLIFDCRYCPLGGEEYQCLDLAYRKWENAQQTRTRKKYAKLFLGQIQSLRSKK